MAEAAPVPGPDARHGRSQFSAAERFSKKPPCGSAWFMLLSAGHSSSTLLQTVMATNHDLVDAARRRVLSATLPEPPSRLGARFDPDAIIDCRTNALLAAEVALGRLHRYVSQKELNLLQLTSRSMAEASAGSAQVMRR